MIDFPSINHTLKPCIESIVKNLYPSGKKVGTEYKVGSIMGEPGTSFSINLESGVWKDFATDDVSGGDIVALYAQVKGLSMADAAKQLIENYAPDGIKYLNGHATKQVKPKPPIENPTEQFIAVPTSMAMPNLKHSKYGNPTNVYKYQDKERLFGVVVRYDLPESKKEFRPWSINMDTEWVPKAWKQNSPLYAQERWTTTEKFIIVEGEKCVNALYTILPNTSITTWQGGVNGISRADLSPLLNAKKIVLWPDNDEPGIKCMNTLASKIYSKNPTCEIFIINIPESPNKYDAADFVNQGKTVDDFKYAIQNHTRKWEPAKTAELVNDNKKIAPEGSSPNPPSDDVYKIWANIGLELTTTMTPHINISNVVLILKVHFKDIEIWYDTFCYSIMIKYGENESRRYSDEDPYIIAMRIQTELKIPRMTDEMVHKGITTLAIENKKSELAEWLNSLTWDGINRVDSFFQDYVNAENNEYTQAVSKNFWVSMAARGLRPGCKADSMVILEGKQGVYKSTMLKIIASEKWFTEAHHNIKDKDFYQTLNGKLIIEVAELGTFSKAESNEVKKMITTAIDFIRLPYGRTPMNFPRQCIFVGTTNDSEYLKDPTGARRFWPIEVNGMINTKKLKEDREQLFAEAVALFKQGNSWHSVPESAKDIQFSKTESDFMEEDVIKFVSSRAVAPTMKEILSELGMDKGDMLKVNSLVQKRISNILRKNGYTNKLTRANGKPTRVWRKELAEQLNIK